MAPNINCSHVIIYLACTKYCNSCQTKPVVFAFKRFTVSLPQTPTTMQDITVDELKQRLNKGEEIIVIDVREPHEYADYNIGARLIPLGTFAAHLEEYEDHKNDEIVLHCRSGKRSATAKEIMVAQGFTKVRNLLGGMLEWQAKFG